MKEAVEPKLKGPRPKALAMFSGGLDSAIAVGVMLRQQIEVVAVHFVTPFMSGSFEGAGAKKHISDICAQLGVELQVVPLIDEYVDMLRRPAFGFGKHLNPCIDCKILFLCKAKQMLDPLKADFVITGDVLGQRPMSQRRDALGIIDRESGLRGYLLRPLSAKHMDPTIPEKLGWVDRERLLGITGRGRKMQLEFARQAGITGYSNPAGGCLLADETHSRKVRSLLESRKEITIEDLELLKLGRHFVLDSGARIMVGRNEWENGRMLELRGAADWVFTPENFPGPVALAIGDLSREELEFTCGAALRYGDAQRSDGAPTLRVERGDGSKDAIEISPAEAVDNGLLERLRF